MLASLPGLTQPSRARAAIIEVLFAPHILTAPPLPPRPPYSLPSPHLYPRWVMRSLGPAQIELFQSRLESLNRHEGPQWLAYIDDEVRAVLFPPL